MKRIRKLSFCITKFTFRTFFVLAVLESSAHASTSADSAIGDVGRRMSAFAEGLTEFITPAAVARLQFGTVCALPAMLPAPATLGGPVAGPIAPTDAHQLRCISVLAPPTLGAGELVSTLDTDITPEASRAASPSIVAQTRVPFGMGTSVVEPVSAAGADAAHSSTEESYVPSSCGQDRACAERAATVKAKRMVTYEPLSAASSLFSVDPEVLLFAAQLLIGLGLLALLVLACWALYRWRFTPEARLVRAAERGLIRGEFGLEYRPVVDIRDGKCAGIEALLRWDNPEFGLSGQMHYMRRLENSKAIGPVTGFMLATAASEVTALSAAKSLYLAVRVAGAYMATDNFESDMLDANKGILRRLVLEVTESDCADATPRLLKSVAALRKQGIRFALAGVGLGPLKLGLLRKFDFDLIKTDRQVLGLDGYDRMSALATMSSMARDIGAVFVAEGVDSAAHHHEVCKAGADLGQGFFYSRALSIKRLGEFLESGGPSRLAVTTQRKRSQRR